MSTSTMADRQQAIRQLEDQLARTPRSQRPHEHAALSYRLGLAYAESTGTQTEGFRRALKYFDTAASIFDPRFDPVEHARVLNAAGSAHRGLGNRIKAAQLFEQAAQLFQGKEGREAELAAALNNLGLVRTEQGQLEAAIEAFDQAVGLFDTSTPDGRRGKVATLANRGQAHAAMGTDEGLEAAVADYEEAQGDVDIEEAPYHYGHLQHSMGVAFSALANRKPDERERLLQEAAAAFKESLVVFTRSTMPYQFALAKHNLGLAYVGLGGVVNQRRALACFEDTVGMLDPRLQSDAWRQAYASLERVENDLKAQFEGMTRISSFVDLLASLKADERYALLRERLFHYMALPEPQRSQFLTELDLAMAKLEPDKAKRMMEDELTVLIELPKDRLEVGLQTRLRAHQAIDDEEVALAADTALDQAIGNALGGPQRILVRDYLEGIGWERP
ncbi:MAG TPA: tetratricopeptide repeat protein [Acidimicrobiales bacterium]|jgi:tetratricopeptide (TPR) repeat protein|nr:tetratricopeptide repeat protein [Acidimicrobiales bacterium]